jgi:hypothetical protein
MIPYFKKIPLITKIIAVKMSATYDQWIARVYRKEDGECMEELRWCWEIIAIFTHPRVPGLKNLQTGKKYL